MQSGQNIQCTTVWQLNIDRSIQQHLPTPAANIKKWSDTELTYDENGPTGIIFREQSFLGKGHFVSKADLEALWVCGVQGTTNASLSSYDEISVGVSDPSPIITTKKTKIGKKRNRAELDEDIDTSTTSTTSTPTRAAPSTTSATSATSTFTNSTTNISKKCLGCGLWVLRNGNTDKHKKTCEGKLIKKQYKQNNFRNNVKAAGMQAVSSANTATSKTQQTTILLPIGLARKPGRKPSKRHSPEQKEIMIDLFEAGERKKSKYTPAMARTHMIQVLGEEQALEPKQIKAFWGSYKQKRLKNMTKQYEVSTTTITILPTSV